MLLYITMCLKNNNYAYTRGIAWNTDATKGR